MTAVSRIIVLFFAIEIRYTSIFSCFFLGGVPQNIGRVFIKVITQCFKIQ